MTQILKLNEISPLADSNLPKGFELVTNPTNPEGVIVRSFSMLDYELPNSVLAIARAGAGVNNIPVDACTEKGVVVFNTPGANANAVKELVICSLFLASRKITDGINFAGTLKENVAKAVEKGKSAFVGPEIMGKTLGLVGLGAIGSLVANAAEQLGMTVFGYDPFISIEAAWHLPNTVRRETDLNQLYAESDYISLHVPFTAETKCMINAEAIAQMKDGVRIVNCSRAELVDNNAIKDAISSGKVACYVTDFPTEEVLNTQGIVTIPHLGASTPEAEDNCAVMAAKELGDFLVNGNILNSVNFPNVSLPRSGGSRVTAIHKNVKGAFSKMSEKISSAGVNISNMISQSRGSVAYAIFELDEPLPDSALESIQSIPEVIKIRVI